MSNFLINLLKDKIGTNNNKIKQENKEKEINDKTEKINDLLNDEYEQINSIIAQYTKPKIKKTVTFNLPNDTDSEPELEHE